MMLEVVDNKLPMIHVFNFEGKSNDLVLLIVTQTVGDSYFVTV